jgi:hypothetical protein
MGIDANFYFRTSITPDNVMTALKTIGRTNVEFRSTNSPNYVQILFNSNQDGWEKRSMHFFFNSSDGFGFDCNHISLKSDDESIQIFEELASMIGGVLQRYDYENNAEMFQKPGCGDFRWLVDQYYLRNNMTPRNADQDIKAFVKWNRKDEV